MNAICPRPGSVLRVLLPFALLGTLVSAQHDNSYSVTTLVADQPGAGKNVDPLLVNGWGLARSGSGPWWVAAADTSVARIYDGTGAVRPLTVQVPGNPTGTVFNGTSSFVVVNGTASAPATFLFASEDGTISGWNAAVPPPSPSTQAFVVADRSAVGASYKGLAIASTRAGAFLYATDFHNARVDVFDGSFQLLARRGAFVDPRLPAGFAPFGIQELEGRIYVTYAKQDEKAADEVAGQGLGFVDVYETDGTFVDRVATRGQLNAPWGLAIAPRGFGPFSGDLLVGNFGDGTIHAYDRHTFAPRGQLRGADHRPLVIEGLWGIAFGNDAAAGPSTTLFFAAGPGDEEHGAFGTVTVH